MIIISENINIKADINKIWSFIIDFEISLSYNRFHRKIELPNYFSIGKKNKFKIVHNFGLGDYDMWAEVTDFSPLNILCLREYPLDKDKRGFVHEVTYNIQRVGSDNVLNYITSGTYGRKVQDLSFKPILKGAMIEELIKIKNAIESSIDISKSIENNRIKPI
jgi:hypothetical protein